LIDSSPVSDWPWVDLLGLLFVLVFGFLGLLRGLWWQVVRLIGVLLAVLAARGLSSLLAARLHAWVVDLDPRVAHGLAWLAVFAATLTIVALVGRLGKGALELLQLDLIDRVGGMLAGIITGMLCFSVFLISLGLLAPQHWLLDHVPGTRAARWIDLCARRVPLVLDAEGSARWLEVLQRDAEGAPSDSRSGVSEAAPPPPPH
jgi:uncharacterized membrane protein required for colicin V production